MRAGWALMVPVMVLVVGCTPTTMPTSAPPTPTFLCTPEAGGSEAPCTQQQYDQMKVKDAQYAEAEKVYREFISEYETTMRNGGADALPVTLVKIVASEDIKANLLTQFKSFKAQKLRLVGSGMKIASVTRQPSKTTRDAAVTMEFCVDASSMVSYKGEQKNARWGISREMTYFRISDDSGAQIIEAQTEVVKSCG